MTEQILFGRMGNKTNDIKHFKHLLPMDVENVVEPFGGTFAVTRIIYKDDKYKKFVNDNDKNLIPIYKHPKAYNNYKRRMNETAQKCIYDTKHVDKKKFMEEIQNMDMDKSEFYDFWKNDKIIRGMIKVTKEFKTEKFIDFMEKINFTYDNYEDVIERHKDDEKAFIFLDPPYLFSNNETYEAQLDEMDMSEIVAKVYDYMTNPDVKCKIMLIINDLKLLRWLFKDMVKVTYNRMYQIAKKHASHLVITNY